MENETLSGLLIELTKLVAQIGEETAILMEHDLGHYDPAYVGEVRGRKDRIREMIRSMKPIVDEVLRQRDSGRGDSL